jgi:hypothetical protein
VPDRPTSILVVTGSRDWDGNPDSITGVLRDFAARFNGYRPELWHGACQGEHSVDMLAADRAKHLGWKVVPFPADWRGLGKRAGPVRNRKMIEKALDDLAEYSAAELHAWPMPNSRGTWDCVNVARKCGIVVVVHERNRSNG